MALGKAHRYLKWLFLLVPVLAGVSASAGERKELDWRWKPAEVKEMRAEIDNVTQDEDGAYVHEGENWIVKTYLTPRFTVQCSKYMEMFSEIFLKAFLFKQEFDFKDVKPTLIIFKSQSAYTKFSGIEGSAGVFMLRWKKQGNEHIPELTLAAYYESKTKEPSFDKDAPLGVIQHEATHCLLRRIFGRRNIPVWLNEGAATYYEAWDIRLRISDDDGSRGNITARKKRREYSWRPRVMAWYTEKKGGELPSLDYLTSLGDSVKWNIDNMGDQTGYHYCISESFTDYLMNSRNRRPFLFTMMERIYNDEHPVITPEEQLEHEKDWLMFLESHWGVKFDPKKIAARVEELRKRVRESKSASNSK